MAFGRTYSLQVANKEKEPVAILQVDSAKEADMFRGRHVLDAIASC